MNQKFITILLLSLLVNPFGCCYQKTAESIASKNLDSAISQFELLLENAYEFDRIPRTVTESGEIKFSNIGFDWTEGFFPGICWNLYSVTKDEKYKQAGQYFN